MSHSQKALSRRRHWLRASAVACAVLAAACAPRSQHSDEPLIFEDDERFTQAPVEAQVEIPRTRTGSIARAKFDATLDAGVGSFLGSIDVIPHAVDGRFEGWEVENFDNPWVDLLPGDIVQTVNGRQLETPGQVQALWLSLRNAQEIRVAVIRGEATFDLRFTVHGAAAPEGT